MTTGEIIVAAKMAAPSVAALSSEEKDRALCLMADAVTARKDEILAANAADLDAARDRLSSAMIDRLALTDRRISDMANGIRTLTKLPDPIGQVMESRVLENKLQLEKQTVPLGLVAIIYESRPNVTSDAAALCIKSGNSCLLRGGRDAVRSSTAIVSAMREGLKAAGIPTDAICLAEDTDHRSADEIMQAVGYVDLLIPRGGAGLISACVRGAKVPVLQTGTGICHIYVDKDADIEKALDIVENAKTSRPSVCNAAEVCLVHRDIADRFLPRLKERLVDKRASASLPCVELRLDDTALKVIDGTPAGERDFDTEFLDYILAVKVVDSVKDATDHIAAHSTGHSEAIVTDDTSAAEFFTRAVDSAAVYVNASTRFTDGGQFGLGCEMGISTQKLHARGPVGLRELTSYKYIIRGNGQIRK